MKGGLKGLLENFSNLMQNPYQITLFEDSLKTVLIFLLAYRVAIGVYLSKDRNYRRREEHGSARWGNPDTLNKYYA